jgi:monoamine oxidase
VKSGGGMAALGDGELGAQKWKIKGGSQQVSEKLVDLLRNEKGIQIQLSSAVDIITLQDDGTVRVESSNGSCFSAKYVIFAISPQLVANICFSPPLLPGKMELCRSLIAGHAVKVYIVYQEPFWLQTKLVKDIHFTELGYIHNLFHSSFSYMGKEYPALVGLVTGTSALEFEKLTEAQRRESVLMQIKSMYGDTGGDPLYYGDKLWADETFSGGCYAGIVAPVGTLVKFGPHIRSTQGPLHWGSTETASHFYGYMEGALLAGQRAADEVLNALM